MITIFTPTYNRGYIIEKLYLSLCNQTSNEFEWLVVDDGSTDNTRDLIERFIADNKINIRYIYKENGGKHTAINLGVKNANGELFFIVDSDDYLTPDAVEWIINNSRDIILNDKFAGMSGLRIHPDGRKIGGGSDFGIIDADALIIRNKHKIRGDLAEIYKTHILKQYPFPEIPNERFCSEGLIWARIAQKYILRYFYKGIYVCEYLNDGLSFNKHKLRLNSPQYTMLLYSELIKYNTPIMTKIKNAINFWAFSFSSSNITFKRKIMMIGYINVIFYPIGYIFYLKYRKSIND